MSGGSGGSGSGGRSGGGAGSGDAGQPGEVVRVANARKETLDEQIARSYRELGMTPPGEMTKAERDAANTRNLESSRQSDIMEGGKSFRNPSVYKSNAPPKYTPKTPTPAKKSSGFPANAKPGDTFSTNGKTFRKDKFGTWIMA